MEVVKVRKKNKKITELSSFGKGRGRNAPSLLGANVKRIKLQIGENFATGTLNDSPAANEFYSQLPLDITMKDFSSKEKIYVLTKKLSTQNRSSAPGDIAYYIPWGNIALFYNQTMNPDDDLMILGKFDSGRDLLSVPGNITLRIEPLE